MRLSELEKQEYADWARQVLANGHLARHEFRRVGLLPQRVLHDRDVSKIGVEVADIEISDYLLRHGYRSSKEVRGASLCIEDLAYLPDRLEAAKWFFDPKHGNVIAFFDINDQVMVGKAVVHFKYMRKGKGHNAVITTGIVQRTNVQDGGKRQI